MKSSSPLQMHTVTAAEIACYKFGTTQWNGTAQKHFLPEISIKQFLDFRNSA